MTDHFPPIAVEYDSAPSLDALIVDIERIRRYHLDHGRQKMLLFMSVGLHAAMRQILMDDKACTFLVENVEGPPQNSIMGIPVEIAGKDVGGLWFLLTGEHRRDETCSP